MNETTPDGDLWQFVVNGSIPAFELLVRRHQSLVCAVAYNACGNLAQSEDVAQETFWTAWRTRGALREPGRLKAWLCGIARNLGQNARRRATRGANAATVLDTATDLAAREPGPVDQAAAHEEETLVWQALEQIPELYREPLVLYYREQQSVVEVAQALELGEDAVRQRLSRGRAMLREQVAQRVEATLSRSRLTGTFTLGVMSGVTALSVGGTTALAGAAASGGATGLAGVAGTAFQGATATSVTGGIVGSVLGPILGIMGGWLGAWLPAQFAPSQAEREYLQRAGRRTLLVMVLFAAVLAIGVILPFRQMPQKFAIAFLGVWFVSFMAYLVLEAARSARAVGRFRRNQTDAVANDAPLRLRLNAVAARHCGRVYRSRAALCGWPLIDINVNDPAPPLGNTGALPPPPPRIARGWVAIGDDARGLLLAVGLRASGLIAIGGRSFGVISVGGMAVGLIAFGGLALGPIALGGLALGGLALGGCSVGWQAAGGCAIAADVACGGGAAAWHAAYGGAAFAYDYALGGAALAVHANDVAAHEGLDMHPLKRGMDWYATNVGWITLLIVLASLAPTGVMLPLMYRRTTASTNALE